MQKSICIKEDSEPQLCGQQMIRADKSIASSIISMLCPFRMQEIGLQPTSEFISLVSQISICSEKKIRIYRFADRSEQTIDEVESITSLCISADSRYLLVNLSSQVIHLWDLGGSRLPQKPAIKYKGQKQGRYVIRSCFGGSAQKFIVSGSEDSQVSSVRHSC